MSDPIVVVRPDEAGVVAELCRIVEAEARTALSADRGPDATFHLGLSGGSLAKFLVAGLPKIATDWTRWRLFFCDERLVPEDSPDSTWGVYQAGLLQVTPLTRDQFLVVNTGLEPEAAARDYQAQLVDRLGGPRPRLDLLLLGAGPDGHTCSLFPGHPLLAEPGPDSGGRLVASVTDSPKPPPCRVTLTLPAVNSARCCVFAAAGQGKAETMARLLGPMGVGEEELPARRVRPGAGGRLYWILDQGAASLLKEK